jgi:hypothetical protein
LAAEEAELGAEAARMMQVGERMPPGQALAVAIQALEQAQVRPRYTLYRIAVLQPGLSAAHRRLIFARALREQQLVLPGGEFQPRDQ